MAELELAEQKLIDQSNSFETFDLDSRLLRALAKLKFTNPTLIQSKAIPLALSGKDILARARTGSGKTAAYCLPVVQKILIAKESLDASDPSRAAVRSLILVPTRELAEQVTVHLNGLFLYCSADVKAVNLAGNTPLQLQQPTLADLPDIVVATPSRALAHLEAQNLILRDTLETLVIDEADLVLSYGYDEDDVESLKQLILRNPAILKLEEEKDEPDLLTQYVARCSEKEKFLLITLLMKLRLVKGKAIIFVNDIDRCYRLKLYFEQFGIKSCVLNSELPLNSRYHIVQEFNKGVYDYIIATDEGEMKGEQDSSDEEEELEDEITQTENAMEDVESVSGKDDEDGSNFKETKKRKSSTETLTPSKDKKKGGKRPRQDKEYGVARGVDFQGVAAVINFDFPTSAKSYTHRVGRTARGGQKGMSISFVVPAVEVEGNDKGTTEKVLGLKDEKVLKKVEKQQAERGATIKPYIYDKKHLHNLNYRAEDALRAVTKTAVREARVKELKAEILNSDHLKAHFEDNPRDFAFLRHDKPLHPTRVQSHMKHIPSYLMPRIAAPAGGTGDVIDAKQSGADSANLGHINFRKNVDHRRRGPSRQAHGQKPKRKNDPLKTFSMASKSTNKSRKR
ncbi:P-loop containing nucleoside triphosphate hydrolase protein [Endogone sp. FLAS-F59071]|nr:P-loop containing nucleoside triphosphate hydrolase protein [Endogone sp. FLAS-F59071]|eukprot:RUS20464.1 P-loop containing nucleoside triphosphate hydrolase protein [Endogone sp. FLAS-F59071]